MREMAAFWAGVSPPTGPAYSLVLLLHVVSAVVGFGSLTAAGVFARRARRGPDSPGADGVRRYFRPGPNLAGRTLYLVPVLGFALVGLSRGALSAGDGFVLGGLALWAAAAAIAEAVVWPGERRIRDALAAGTWPGDDPALGACCARVARAVAVLDAVFVVAVVIMITQP